MEYRHTLDRDDRRREGLRGADRRRGGPEGDRPEAGAGGRRRSTAASRTSRVKVKAGPHKVGVTFVARSFAESDDVLYAVQAGRPARSGCRESAASRSSGPFNPAGLSDTPSRQRIFVCHPANAGEELPCATQILSTLARRAFRRPVTDADLEAPLALLSARRRATGDFEAGIQRRADGDSGEPEVPVPRRSGCRTNVAPGTIYRISDLELASRLSFFLWSQRPGRGAARRWPSRASCSEPAVLEAQVQRMLADPRSKSLVTNFAFQWLNVREIDSIEPDPVLFPDFDDEPARRLPQRDGAVRRQRVARGPQRARSADRRTTPS